MDFATPEVQQRCDYIAQLYNISNEDILVHWEALKYKYHNINTKPTLNLLDDLQKYIQSNITTTQKQPPVKKRKLTSNESSTTTTTITETFNSNIISKPTTIPYKSFKIIGDFTPSKYNYKTMNLKLLEIADFIDEKIESFTDLICNHNNIQPDQLGNPNIQSQSEIYTVGRIVPDSPTTQISQLNIDSLHLEVSRRVGFGYRIPLNLSSISTSLFPGQIVGLKGINQQGRDFKVLEVLPIPYLGSPSFTIPEIEEFMDTLGDDNLKIAVLSGPYHSKNTLDFSNLEKIINQCNNSINPDLVILTGPFIDTRTVGDAITSLLNEDVSDLKNLDDLFQAYIAPLLADLNCAKKIIIPHSADTISHSVYPQPKLDRRVLGLDKSFKCFPNPATFSINESSIGVSTHDVLRELKEVGLTKGDRLERVINHVIQQRSFNPTSQPKNTDVSFMGLAEFNDTLPDILILPSVVKPFVKCVKNVVVVNPGSVINGSFSLIQVKSPDVNDMEAVGDGYVSSAWKRSRVDMYTV